MTSESGASLKVGLAPLTAAPLTAVAGQAQGSTVLYPAPDPASPRDVAVQATAFGFKVGVVLHNANESPSLSLQLALDAGSYLKQESSGDIQVIRPITSYGDSGTTPNITLQPEYVIGNPVALDAAAGAAALEHAGPTSMSIGPASGGNQSVTVALDSAWLHDSSRIFPLTVTIPVIASLAASHTGTFTTANSCAPTSSPLFTDVVVGVDGGCTYQGRLYFALPPVPAGSTIISATLGLSTPDQATATGVQVYMNAPLSFPFVGPTALDPSGGVNLPAVAVGTPGISEVTVGSPIHTWDVTTIVQQWLRDRQTNGGLTLMGSGVPVRFASPMGSGDANLVTAPVLNITYAPTGSPAPTFSDGGYTVFGLSGSFSACDRAVVQCNPNDGISTYGALSLLSYLAYARIEAQFTNVGTTCPLNTMPTAIHGDPQDINTMLTSMFNFELTPIVVLTPNPNCLSSETPAFWQQQANYFVAHMSFPKTSLIYFEIGNEPNITPYPPLTGTYAGYGGTFQGYADRFAAAAAGIVSAMGSSTKYRVLTGGMSQPTASVNCTGLNGDINYYTAAVAISEAENAPYNVSSSELGVAVHPYNYRTGEPTYWRNYTGTVWPGAPYVDVCTDLSAVINLWTTGTFSSFPVFFTEDNWADQPNKGNNRNCYAQTLCEGTYLADLFTWLIDHGYTNPATSPVRIAWFTGLDFPNYPLGVRGPTAGEKYFSLTKCPSTPALQTYIAVWTVFFYLDYPGYTCY